MLPTHHRRWSQHDCLVLFPPILGSRVLTSEPKKTAIPVNLMALAGHGYGTIHRIFPAAPTTKIHRRMLNVVSLQVCTGGVGASVLIPAEHRHWVIDRQI